MRLTACTGWIKSTFPLKKGDRKRMIIAVDFDGTLCEWGFPGIGKPISPIINWCIRQQGLGHKIILWTCRDGELLDKALAWCATQAFIPDAANKNIEGNVCSKNVGQSKIVADIYLDDRSMKITDVVKFRDARDFIDEIKL